MMELDLATIVSVVNILFLIALLVVYVKNYLKLKAPISLGLILFALLFLIQNLGAVYCQNEMIEFYSKPIANFAFILNVFEALGLASLVYISYKS